MCGIGMFVNATEECRRCVFADLLCQQVAATRVFIEEYANIVNETSDEN